VVLGIRTSSRACTVTIQLPRSRSMPRTASTGLPSRRCSWSRARPATSSADIPPFRREFVLDEALAVLLDGEDAAAFVPVEPLRPGRLPLVDEAFPALGEPPFRAVMRLA